MIVRLIILGLFGCVIVGSAWEWMKSRDDERNRKRYDTESHARLMAELRRQRRW